MKNISKLIPTALLACSLGAQAAVTITIQQVGDDVVVSSTGSIDTLSGLTFHGTDSASNLVWPSRGLIAHGTRDLQHEAMQVYKVPNYPDSFGTGGISLPVDASGDFFAVTGADPESSNLLFLPLSQTAPFPANFTMRFANQTLSTMEMSVGKYEWTWGTAQDGDSITLYVGIAPEPPAPTTPTSVPTLGSFGLMGLAGIIGAAGVAMTRRRKQ